MVPLPVSSGSGDSTVFRFGTLCTDSACDCAPLPSQLRATDFRRGHRKAGRCDEKHAWLAKSLGNSVLSCEDLGTNTDFILRGTIVILLDRTDTPTEQD